MKSPSAATPFSPKETSLLELALLFAKLGSTAFGGPAAHIAMMKDEVVDKRKWMSEEKFLDYVSATNLIPGPSSTELAIHIGHQQRGWWGLLVAGLSFIVPAMLIVWLLAWSYVQYGSIPEVSGILYGIKPVIIAIVLQALWSLGRSSVKSPTLAVLGISSILALLIGVNEIFLLLMIGFITMSIQIFHPKKTKRWMMIGFVVSLLTSVKAWANFAKETASIELQDLFFIFLKIGSVLFGSGYVLLAFLQADFVDRLHLLTHNQLLDAIAVGQMTPGPVFTTATFIGYLLAGNSGALLATLGIFLPAFFFVAITAPFLPKMRQSPLAAAFLDGVNVASLALMAYVSWELGRSALLDLPSVCIFLGAGAVLLRYKMNSAWLVGAGALCGYALLLVR